MSDPELLSEVRSYVVREMLHGDGRGLDENSPLLEWGVIESLSMVSLIRFMEDRYGIKIPDDEIVPDNFANLTAIAALVERRKSA